MTCRHIVSAYSLAVAAALFSASAYAQGRLTGVVYDSVAAKPLASALVQMALVSDPRVMRSVRTDIAGRFQMDSVPEGTWVAAVMHPRIDSLGIEQLTRPVSIRSGGEQRTTLAVPSARTLVREICGDTASDESGFLFGTLRSMSRVHDTLVAHVDVQWIDMLVSLKKGVGFTREPRRITMNTTEDGAFTVCGLPSGGTVRVRGFRGTDTTGLVELPMPDHGIARIDLAVGAVTHVQQDSNWVRRGNGMLRGRVESARAQPISNSSISVWGSDIPARTDSTGLWQLRQLPMGTHTVEARAVGYRPQRFVVDIDDQPNEPLVVTLERMNPLDTVRVRGLREQWRIPAMQAFERRRQAGLGFFRGPEELDAILPVQTSDVFRFLPGIRVVSTRDGDAILMRAARGEPPCAPDLFIDGVQFSSKNNQGLFDQFVQARDMRAVEVYSGSINTPAEFRRADNTCGTIVIWTGQSGSK